MDSETTQAIEIIRQGNLAEGAKILSRVLNRNPEDEIAWLWLSACVSDREKKIYCLQRVLQIDPAHQAARKGLASMGVTLPEIERQPVPPAEMDGFSYRDLTAAFNSHETHAEQPPTAGEMKGGTFADAVRQAQANEPLPPLPEEPVPQRPPNSERAMMMEDFGFSNTPEPEIAQPVPPLEPVTPQPRHAQRKKKKTNWLLGILLILLVLLLAFLLVARFVVHVI